MRREGGGGANLHLRHRHVAFGAVVGRADNRAAGCAAARQRATGRADLLGGLLRRTLGALELVLCEHGLMI